MFICETYRKKKDKVYKYRWLVENYRTKGGKIKRRYIINISNWDTNRIQVLKKALEGELVDIEAFKTIKSLEFGNVYAVLSVLKDIGLQDIIYTREEKWRKILIAMIIAQILKPSSKLSMSFWLNNTSLPHLLGLKEISSNCLYEAMDELEKRQENIQKKLVKRHLNGKKTLVLYDVTAAYYEGEKCELADYGYPTKGKRQIIIGLLTDMRGRPCLSEVYKGNTRDLSTFKERIEETKKKYGLEKVIFVTDRGMISEDNIKALKEAGFDYITALTHRSILEKVKNKEHPIQLSLFDEKNIVELLDPNDPSIRYFLCKNPITAQKEKKTRDVLLQKTKTLLDRLVKSVREGKIKDKDKILIRASRYSAKFKVSKFFAFDAKDGEFWYKLNQEVLEEEEALDGCYVVTTNVSQDELSKEEVVERYKGLRQVEQDFRCMKRGLLNVEPIRHRLQQRVKAHVFLCTLALYLQHELKNRLSSLLQIKKENNFCWNMESILCHLGRIREEVKCIEGKEFSVRSSLDEIHHKIFNYLGVKVPGYRL